MELSWAKLGSAIRAAGGWVKLALFPGFCFSGEFSDCFFLYIYIYIVFFSGLATVFFFGGGP